MTSGTAVLPDAAPTTPVASPIAPTGPASTPRHELIAPRPAPVYRWVMPAVLKTSVSDIFTSASGDGLPEHPHTTLCQRERIIAALEATLAEVKAADDKLFFQAVTVGMAQNPTESVPANAAEIAAWQVAYGESHYETGEPFDWGELPEGAEPDELSLPYLDPFHPDPRLAAAIPLPPPPPPPAPPVDDAAAPPTVDTMTVDQLASAAATDALMRGELSDAALLQLLKTTAETAAPSKTRATAVADGSDLSDASLLRLLQQTTAVQGVAQAVREASAAKADTVASALAMSAATDGLGTDAGLTAVAVPHTADGAPPEGYESWSQYYMSVFEIADKPSKAEKLKSMYTGKAMPGITGIPKLNFPTGGPTTAVKPTTDANTLAVSVLGQPALGMNVPAAADHIGPYGCPCSAKGCLLHEGSQQFVPQDLDAKVRKLAKDRGFPANVGHPVLSLLLLELDPAFAPALHPNDPLTPLVKTVTPAVPTTPASLGVMAAGASAGAIGVDWSLPIAVDAGDDDSDDSDDDGSDDGPEYDEPDYDSDESDDSDDDSTYDEDDL